MDYKKYIARNPDVMIGKPAIIGTRITVEFLLFHPRKLTWHIGQIGY